MMLSVVLFAALAATASVCDAFSPVTGTGKTTRYWDCCKPTCAWRENAGDVTKEVRSCDKTGRNTVSRSTQSVCATSSSPAAYMCSNQQPFIDPKNKNLAYGFVAANVNGLPTSSLCCSCFKLTFKDSKLKGKTMIVQVTNTGSDLGLNHFDIQLPGGGVGIFTQGCGNQWGSIANWGRQYGGVSSGAQCNGLPRVLRYGCKFYFGWFGAADNPAVDFERVKCPRLITTKTGCQRKDD